MRTENNVTSNVLFVLKQAELLAAVRRRRKIQDDDDSDDVDEEDLGLPRSPSMHSPTIATGNDLLLSKVSFYKLLLLKPEYLQQLLQVVFFLLC